MGYSNIRNLIYLKKGGKFPRYIPKGAGGMTLEEFDLNYINQVIQSGQYGASATPESLITNPGFRRQYINEHPDTTAGWGIMVSSGSPTVASTGAQSGTVAAALKPMALTPDAGAILALKIPQLKTDIAKLDAAKAAVFNSQQSYLATGDGISDLISGAKDVSANGIKNIIGGGLSKGFAGLASGASQIYGKAIDFIDNLTMGDKNFGALSQAIDAAADAAAELANNIGSKFGPMGAVAGSIVGAGIKTANFLTKAGGLTVLGFDVDVNSSGYGENLGHMDSSSSRDFGAMLGLGGLNNSKILAKLLKRNELAQMALKAANIAEDLKFELEARSSSILNTITNNMIALSGGLDTNLLGS